MKVLLITVLLAFSGFTFKTECREDFQEMKVMGSCGASYDKIVRTMSPVSGGSVYTLETCRDCWQYQMNWGGVTVLKWTECN